MPCRHKTKRAAQICPPPIKTSRCRVCDIPRRIPPNIVVCDGRVGNPLCPGALDQKFEKVSVSPTCSPECTYKMMGGGGQRKSTGGSRPGMKEDDTSHFVPRPKASINDEVMLRVEAHNCVMDTHMTMCNFDLFELTNTPR